MVTRLTHTTIVLILTGEIMSCSRLLKENTTLTSVAALQDQEEQRSLIPLAVDVTVSEKQNQIWLMK